MPTHFIIYPTTPVANLGRKMRGAFMIRTFTNLALAIVVFLAIQVVFLEMQWGAILAGYASPYPFWSIAAICFVMGGLAVKIARHATRLGTQYAALLMFVVVEAILFAPLVHAVLLAAPRAAGSLAAAPVICTLGLLGIGVVLREEFLFGKALLIWFLDAALAVAAGGLLGAFDWAAWTAAGIVALAALAILYANIGVLQDYSRDRHAAAALELFAAIPLMPWHAVTALFGTRR